jgi:hypothetical protein
MPSEPNWSETDLSRIDLKTLTPEQWVALKREVNRRAHAERAEVLRELVALVRSWWPLRVKQETRMRRDPARGDRIFVTAHR